MLLNSFGEPTLLTPETYSKEFKESPLLLCHKRSLWGKLLPKDWTGCMYASENILDNIKQRKAKINQPYSYEILSANETTDIYLKNSIELNNHIKVTMIPLDEENFIYLIKDEHVSSLLTDILSENMDAFLCNNILRMNLKTGIDTLYINDGVYHKSSQLPIYPTETLLGALVTLVKPRYVFGITGNELPQYFSDCCFPLSGY